MSKEKVIAIVKNVVISFFIFSCGFIATMLPIINQSERLTTEMININMEVTKHVNFLGINIMKFQSIAKGEIFEIQISRTSLFEYIPFITGFGLLILVWILTFLTKKAIHKNRN